MELLRTWYYRHFSDPQAIGLAVVLIVGTLLVVYAGQMLAPVVAAAVIAYLLEAPVISIERRRIPRFAAASVVFGGFLLLMLFFLIALLPLLYRQVVQLVRELPNMFVQGQQLLLTLPERYPDIVSREQVQDIIGEAQATVLSAAQQVVSFSLASVVDVITILVYMILVPVLVFFFLKDKRRIAKWLQRFLPDERRLLRDVWKDVDRQIGNYVRGKVIEILIVGGVTYVTFTAFGLQFALLLSVLVGLSVLIPYIGATAVTVPVALIAFFQWGFASPFGWVLGAYLLIQILDGNVLVPLLFSEVVNLHPIAIIVAILVFGGIWGFWGVFFAIPLATGVQAVLKAWPSFSDGGDEETVTMLESQAAE